MLGPALKQLFVDLDQLVDRSEYEDALHRELSLLGQVFGAIDQNLGVTFPRVRTTRHNSYKAWIEQTSAPEKKFGEFEVGTAGARIRLDPLDSGQPETHIDLDTKDIKRLRCSNKSCPNKRL